jgi:hypothetical protein
MSAALSTGTTAPNYGSVSLGNLYPQASTVKQLSATGTSGNWLVFLGIDVLNPPGGPGVYVVSGITQPLKANLSNNSDVGWIVAIIVVHPTCVYLLEFQANYGGSGIAIVQSGGSPQNLGSVSAFSTGSGWLCLTIGGGTDSTRVWGAYMSKISSA